MMPFDPAAPFSSDRQASLSEKAPATPTQAIENKKGSIEAAPSAATAVGALPPCWQGATPFQLMIHGPDSARFEEPPPANPEPPEPEEAIGETLTERQLLFCERYVECPVAARAARAAGYAEATAATQASRMLKHPRVLQRILELRRKRSLEWAYRRETLLDKFEAVFADALERHDLYAAIKALTMQARLARIDEAHPGFRQYRRFADSREQLIWDALTRLEQKLTEIQVGDFPGAAAAVPATPFADAAKEEARKALAGQSPEDRASRALASARKARRGR